MYVLPNLIITVPGRIAVLEWVIIAPLLCMYTLLCQPSHSFVPFAIYVYHLNPSKANPLDLQTLSIAGVKAGSYCIVSDTLCRQAKVAPFVFTIMIQQCTFILWVGFLLVVQTWQIASNKTTNEVSNWYRLEYFNPDTTLPDLVDEGEEEEEGGSVAGPHAHSHACSHKKKKAKKYINPFDKGTLLNCTEFCWGHQDKMYYEMHQLPINKPPLAVVAAAAEPTVKSSLLVDAQGRQAV